VSKEEAMKYIFEELCVSRPCWEVEADTFEEAVRLYRDRRAAGDDPDDEDVEEAELTAILEDGQLLPSAAVRRAEEIMEE
jgi:hypothetical protein